MKSICYLIAATLLISASAFAQSEETAIQKTVTDYLEGGTKGDVNRFKSAFVSDAVQRSVSKAGGVTGISVNDLATKIQPGTTMDRTTRIISWSYANDAATAITETVYSTSKIIDLLNLLKVNGEWKIVSRVFSRMEPGEEVASNAAMSKVTTPAKAVKPPVKKKVVDDDGW